MKAPTAVMIVVPAIALLGLASLRDASAFVLSTSSTSNHHHVVATEGQKHSNLHRHCGLRAAKGAAETTMAADSVVDVKSKVLQLAAVMDRGGMANPGKLRRDAFTE